ncbi:MAG: cytochrome family protein [Pedosphaera sp.]|nr:cytochrome family protein [Pedosphaera sp.]
MPIGSSLHALSGPKGSFLVGNLTQFGRNPLGFLEKCAREHGDLVPVRFLNKTVYILNNPEHIEHVLATNARNFRKTLGYRTPFMRRLFGQGLLTSEGDFWLRQRRLAQPAFHRDRIATYARIIVEFTQGMLGTWRVGETRDIHLDMMRVTTEVVTKTLFNSTVPPEINELGEASKVVMERFTKQWSWYRILFNLLPSITEKPFEQVMRRLDAFIYGLIRERRASGRDEGDLLSMLLKAQDEDGSGMTDKQLRDELTTLMVAGLDTTALALSWGFYLLSQNPAVQKALEEEVDRVLGDRSPTFSDLPQLTYTEMVVKETMRLYPSAWIVGREAMQDCEIGGQQIKAGTSLIMSQWLKHRDGRYFKNPEAFIPERWRDAEIKQLPKFAYFPFGGGPRVCIGNSFAMMEAMLVLATVSQQFRLTAAPGYAVEPWPAITLQPRDGISLKIERRRPAVESPATFFETPACRLAQ